MEQLPSKELMEEVTRLRRTLHRYPELSGQERQTAGWIKAFLEKHGAGQVTGQLGGHSLAAVYESGKPGPTLLLRADMDALPIQEVNDFDHRSQHDGISHKCGHDGHTAILAGVAACLGQEAPPRGRVVLLFQGEEETGQGAEKIIRDPLFQNLVPDAVFALHNLPGFKKHEVVVREGPFASASRGMIIHLKGRSSHAAHPEQGNSPGPVLPSLLQGLIDIPGQRGRFMDFVLLTIIHVRLGEVAFGTNPGEATVMATLRSYLDEDMKVFTGMAEALAGQLAEKYGLEATCRYTEAFPATHNHPEGVRTLLEAARSAGASVTQIDSPFRWSEDFGHFTARFPGALFGLGSGRNHPSLHNNDYDFPDEVIPTGIRFFMAIIRQFFNKNNPV